MANDYNEDMEEAARIARAALPLATQLNLPVNPINYAVLYEHVAGQNPELSGEFQKLQDQADTVTMEHIRNLYLNFISQSDQKEIEQITQMLVKILVATKGNLNKAADETKAYGDYLGGTVKELGDGVDQEQLVTVVQNLIAQTNHMQEASQALRDELSEANSDLEKLRDEYDRVKSQTLIDPLTKVNNRRAYDISVDELRKHSLDAGTALSLLVLDVDNFKSINDTHGHVAGDAVLKWVAKVVNRTVRGDDVLSRYGGEEFTVLLPNTDIVGAKQVGENIRKRMEDQQLKLGDMTIGVVTASFGAAQLEDEESCDSFLARADEAMYYAKKTGKNRVCIAGIDTGKER